MGINFDFSTRHNFRFLKGRFSFHGREDEGQKRSCKIGNKFEVNKARLRPHYFEGLHGLFASGCSIRQPPTVTSVAGHMIPHF